MFAYLRDVVGKGRRRNLRRDLAAAAVAALAIAASACGSSAQGGNGQGGVLLVGAMDDLTGAASLYGIADLRAAQFAATQIGDHGVLKIGSKTYRLKLDIVDAGSAPQAATVALKKLQSDGVNYIFGGFASASMPAVLPVINADPNLIVFPESVLQGIANGSTVFRVAAPVTYWDPTLEAYLKSQHYTRVAYISDETDTSYYASQSALQAKVQQGGGTTVASEWFQSSDTDFSAQLTKIKAADPDVIVVRGYPAALSGIQKEIIQLGIQAHIVWEAPAPSSTVKQVITPSLVNGVVNCRASDMEAAVKSGNKAAAALNSYFLAKYHMQAPSTSDVSYNSVIAWAAAVQAAGSLDVGAVRSALKKLQLSNIQPQLAQTFIPQSGGLLFDAKGQASVDAICTAWNGSAGWGPALKIAQQ